MARDISSRELPLQSAPGHSPAYPRGPSDVRLSPGKGQKPEPLVPGCGAWASRLGSVGRDKRNECTF